MYFLSFSNNIGFTVKGKLIRFKFLFGVHPFHDPLLCNSTIFKFVDLLIYSTAVWVECVKLKKSGNVRVMDRSAICFLSK